MVSHDDVFDLHSGQFINCTTPKLVVHIANIVWGRLIKTIG